MGVAEPDGAERPDSEGPVAVSMDQDEPEDQAWSGSSRSLFIKYDDRCRTSREVKYGPDVSPEGVAVGFAGRTLIVRDVPPWATTDVGPLSKVFSRFGPVKEFTFLSRGGRSKVPSAGVGFRSARVVFERKSGLKNAMSESFCVDRGRQSEPFVLAHLSSGAPPVVGLRKWKRARNLETPTDAQIRRLRLEAEARIRGADSARQEERARALQAKDGQLDDDEEGWQVVSRHTSRKPIVNSSALGQARIKAREARKRKKQELADFYRFQTREGKLDRLKELKERFEADKKKLLKLKQERAARKFNPT